MFFLTDETFATTIIARMNEQQKTLATVSEGLNDLVSAQRESAAAQQEMDRAATLLSTAMTSIAESIKAFVNHMQNK